VSLKPISDVQTLRTAAGVWNKQFQANEKGLSIFQNLVGIVSPHFKGSCGLHFQEGEAAHKEFPLDCWTLGDQGNTIC